MFLGLTSSDVQAWAPVAAATASASAAFVALAALRINARGERLQQRAHVTARIWNDGTKQQTTVYIHNAGPGAAYSVSFCAVVEGEYASGFIVPQRSGYLGPGEDTIIKLDVERPGQPRENTSCGVVAMYFDGLGKRYAADPAGEKRFRPFIGWRKDNGQRALERRVKKTRGIDPADLARVKAVSLKPLIDRTPGAPPEAQ